MDETYRGFIIRVSLTSRWEAHLIEIASGAALPTKSTALSGEGRSVALTRARALADLYAGAIATERAA